MTMEQNINFEEHWLESMTLQLDIDTNGTQVCVCERERERAGARENRELVK